MSYRLIVTREAESDISSALAYITDTLSAVGP